ncbi:MAG: hypothetical protein KDK27_20040, partial [Leptospiraceae bacterium]|nr:hypothetical protein [Leptospiraceae bacterium]
VTTLARLGHYKQARKYSRRIAWREPRHAKNLLQLAALEAKAGEPGLAKQLAARAVTEDANLSEQATRITAKLN